jgi:hypothetical protein
VNTARTGGSDDQIRVVVQHAAARLELLHGAGGAAEKELHMSLHLGCDGLLLRLRSSRVSSANGALYMPGSCAISKLPALAT